jgi:hypothetical protein
VASPTSTRNNQRRPQETALPAAALRIHPIDAPAPQAISRVQQSNNEIPAALSNNQDEAPTSSPPASSTRQATIAVLPSVLDDHGLPSHWKNSLAPSSSASWWQASSPAEPTPRVGLSRTTIFFPVQEVGTESEPANVIITNNTSAAMTVSALIITGNDSSDFAQKNDCGRTIAAGTHCFVSLTFRPTANGTRTSVLTVDGATQAITLAGIGK